MARATREHRARSTSDLVADATPAPLPAGGRPAPPAPEPPHAAPDACGPEAESGP
ncbi:hypothetical protein KPATCC21470_7288 [Kitasatospora purpeofusca]